MASTYATYTPASGSNRTKWTFSAWVKLSSTSGSSTLFGSFTANYAFIGFRGGTLTFQETYNGSETIKYRTTRILRDTNAWYHVVVSYNTTSGVSQSDKIKMYVNGVRETSFNFTTMPSTTDYTSYILNTSTHALGANSHGNSNHFDGLMSHVHLCDNYEYSASDFGETDSTTGEWKIKTSPNVQYGTNGFFVLKDGNSLTDQSGNGKNLSVAGGTLTKTEDNPSNVFATLNPLGYAASANYTLANGNTAKTTTGTTNAWRTAYGTMGASSGKYYWEIKITGSESSDLGNFMLGIVSTEQVVNTSSNSYFTQYSHGYGYHAKTGNAMNNTTSSGSSYGASITTNNILGVAMDLDNNKLYFSKDGVFQNSGVPTSGSTGTGAAFTLASDITYLPAFAQYYGAERYAVNFGNGFFETTEITTNTGTGYQDEDNNGRFYYDPPTNYRCLSTKGLNQ